MADPMTLSLIGASTAINVLGTMAQGKAAGRAAEFKAKTETAAGTRQAAEAQRAGKIAESGTRAAMAAGGGVATDPGAIETLGKIKSEAEYNALSALYEGGTRADISRYEGKVKKKAARTKALSTILSGGAGMYKAYKTPPSKAY